MVDNPAHCSYVSYKIIHVYSQKCFENLFFCFLCASLSSTADKAAHSISGRWNGCFELGLGPLGLGGCRAYKQSILDYKLTSSRSLFYLKSL